MSKEEFDFTQAEQGALAPAAPTKTRITIRLDNDVLNWFRNQVHEAGGGYRRRTESRGLVRRHALGDPRQGVLEPVRWRHDPAQFCYCNYHSNETFTG